MIVSRKRRKSLDQFNRSFNHSLNQSIVQSVIASFADCRWTFDDEHIEFSKLLQDRIVGTKEGKARVSGRIKALAVDKGNDGWEGRRKAIGW